MSLSEQLLTLHDLHVRGFLTDAQFSAAKAHEIEATVRAGAAVGGAAAPPPLPTLPPPPMPPTPMKPLNPVVPGVGLALGAAAIANGGLTG